MTIINTKNLLLFSLIIYLVTSFLDIVYKYNIFWFISVIIYILIYFVFLIYSFIEGSESTRFEGFKTRYLIGFVFIFFQLVSMLRLPCGIGSTCIYNPNLFSIFLNITFYVAAIFTLRNNNRKIPVKKIDP